MPPNYGKGSRYAQTVIISPAVETCSLLPKSRFLNRLRPRLEPCPQAVGGPDVLLTAQILFYKSFLKGLLKGKNSLDNNGPDRLPARCQALFLGPERVRRLSVLSGQEKRLLQQAAAKHEQPSTAGEIRPSGDKRLFGTSRAVKRCLRPGLRPPPVSVARTPRQQPRASRPAIILLFLRGWGC